MQNDRTTGCPTVPSPTIGMRLAALLREEEAALAKAAHRPAGEIKLLEARPIMLKLDIHDRANYVSLREALRQGLREQSERIRLLKDLRRRQQRLLPGATSKATYRALRRCRSAHNALLGLRRLAWSWSKAARAGACPPTDTGASSLAVGILAQLADAVRHERVARRISRDSWNSGRDDPRLENRHQLAIDRVDALLRISDELKDA